MVAKSIMLYLEAHESAWALTTWRSERSRLKSVAHVIKFGPEAVMKHLVDRGSKPYTIKTTFMRLAAFEKWRGNSTQFSDYVKKHRNKFRHAYQREELEVTFDEALQRIRRLDEPYRQLATAILSTGLRISETYSVCGDRVVGKGGKTRRVYGTIEVTAPRSTFWRKLKAVGLKPHTLRKLLATRLSDKGATAADLCKVFGWSSIETAYQYLQPKEDAKLLEFIQESTKES